MTHMGRAPGGGAGAGAGTAAKGSTLLGPAGKRKELSSTTRLLP